MSAKITVQTEINQITLFEVTGIRMIDNEPMDIDSGRYYVNKIYLDVKGFDRPFELTSFSDEKLTLGLYTRDELDHTGRVREPQSA